MTSDEILYHVLVDERVEKDLRGVPRHIIDKFVIILDELETNPIRKRPGVDIRRLKRYPDILRIRIGDYRVLYSVDHENHIVRVAMVTHRKKAYRSI